MPDFSFSRPTIRVRGPKPLDYSLNRSSKDSGESISVSLMCAEQTTSKSQNAFEEGMSQG